MPESPSDWKPHMGAHVCTMCITLHYKLIFICSHKYMTAWTLDLPRPKPSLSQQFCKEIHVPCANRNFGSMSQILNLGGGVRKSPFPPLSYCHWQLERTMSTRNTLTRHPQKGSSFTLFLEHPGALPTWLQRSSLNNDKNNQAHSQENQDNKTPRSYHVLEVLLGWQGKGQDRTEWDGHANLVGEQHCVLSFPLSRRFLEGCWLGFVLLIWAAGTQNTEISVDAKEGIVVPYSKSLCGASSTWGMPGQNPSRRETLCPICSWIWLTKYCPLVAPSKLDLC